MRKYDIPLRYAEEEGTRGLPEAQIFLESMSEKELREPLDTNKQTLERYFSSKNGRPDVDECFRRFLDMDPDDRREKLDGKKWRKLFEIQKRNKPSITEKTQRLPENIQESFKKNGHELSKGKGLVLIDDGKWEIQDDDIKYLIKEEEDDYVVYGEKKVSNYDVALSRALGGAIFKARKIMDYLTRNEIAKKNLTPSDFEGVDESTLRSPYSVVPEDIVDEIFCSHCEERLGSKEELKNHLRVEHRDSKEVNWVRGEEVYLGILQKLSEFYGLEETKDRFNKVKGKAPSVWKDFLSSPKKFLVEHGLPQEKSKNPKKELSDLFGFGSTSGFKRADVVFLNPRKMRMVIVENTRSVNKVTDYGTVFDQVLKYAAFMMDDYQLSDPPRTLVNNHAEGLQVEFAQKKHEVTFDGARDTYSVVQNIPITSLSTPIDVFDLPYELQRYLGVAKHYRLK